MTPADALIQYKKAVSELADAISGKPETRLEQAGSIQYFEFCFELAWKTLKLATERQGMNDTASPRACLKTAFALGWIDEEAIWLEMLEARNTMSHTYDSDSAIGIFRRLPDFRNLSR